jgi:hypothetical protein
LLGFINTLNRLSESLAAVDKFTKLWEQRFAEGTLPSQIRDEKLDGLASGKAAQAISLSPGLSPRPHSPFAGMAAEKEKPKQPKTKPDSTPNDSPSKPIASAPLSSTNSQAPISLPNSKAKLTYSSNTHTPSNNRSDPTIQSNIRSHVIDLGLLVRPASKMFKMFSEKCKESFAMCSHWVHSLLGQMKTLVFLSRSHNQNHHFQDQDLHQSSSRNEKNEL